MKSKLFSTLALSLVMFASNAQACFIQDPSSTPTNVRTSPLGKIKDKLYDDEQVDVIRTKYDKNGRKWAYVSYYKHNDYREGWVALSLISCAG